MNGSIARSSGGKSSRNSFRRAGKAVGARAITGIRPSKKPFASGASLPKATSVGESCSAAGTSWRISGSVLTAKVLSRLRVSFDSSRKVGKARKSASMSWSRLAVVWKTALELWIRLASSPSLPRSAWKVVAPLRRSWPTASRWVSRTRKSFSNSVKVGSNWPIAYDRLWPWPLIATAASCIHSWKAARVLRVEGAEDLVELHRFGDVCLGNGAAVGQLRAVARAGGEFDVGLAEQRLGAQDRPGRLGQRRVLVVDVDRRQRLLAVRRQGDALDFADVDAGDADVGLFGELGRLVEGNLDFVGLRLERGRAAEGDPEEEQDPEARQREAGDDQELRGAGGALAHWFRRRSAVGRVGRALVFRDFGEFRRPGHVRHFQQGLRKASRVRAKP